MNKHTYNIRRFVSAAIFIISIIAVLFFSFNIPYKAGRSSTTLDVNGKNREKIVSLIPLEMTSSKDFQNINNAKTVGVLESSSGEIIYTIEYSDGSECSYRTTDSFPLSKYVKSNGYNTYVHSKEFPADLIKPAASAVVAILSAVFFIRSKRKYKASSGRIKEGEGPDDTTYTGVSAVKSLSKICPAIHLILSAFFLSRFVLPSLYRNHGLSLGILICVSALSFCLLRYFSIKQRSKKLFFRTVLLDWLIMSASVAASYFLMTTDNEFIFVAAIISVLSTVPFLISQKYYY